MTTSPKSSQASRSKTELKPPTTARKPHDQKLSNTRFDNNSLREGKYSTVIGKFKELRSNGVTRLPVTLPGTQRRNFTHIDDIVAGILLAAGNGIGDGYGIGANESYSIIDVCELFGCKPDFQPPSAANRMDGQLRTNKIKELGWKQTQYLDSEIKSFLQNIENK